MIQFLDLGRVEYGEGLRLQAEMARLRLEGRVANLLLLLEHPPVLTLGRNANKANILASSELLAGRGVAVHEIDRGGDVTYHGPGQLVGYPIFDLRSLHGPGGKRLGPVDFVRQMEEALIRLCADYGVTAGRIPGLTGVWCPGAAHGSPLGENAAKIAAIGIHVSRGIVTHGFAFNLDPELRDFDLIVPCGIRDHAVTSLRQELGMGATLPTLQTLMVQCARHFGEVLGEPVEDAGSLAAVRDAAQAFPAEDVPMQRPREVERLVSGAEPEVSA